MGKLKVILDTNVLLVSIPTKSPFRLVFESIINGDLEVTKYYQSIQK